MTVLVAACKERLSLLTMYQHQSLLRTMLQLLNVSDMPVRQR